MHLHLELLMAGFALALYGSVVSFYPPAHAYIEKISLDRLWLPQHIAKYSVRYVDGAFTLGLGALLIVAAFVA